MCLGDCIKKHIWRILAIIFMCSTIALSIGWGVSDPCTTTTQAPPQGGGRAQRSVAQIENLEDYVVNPKIIPPSEQMN